MSGRSLPRRHREWLFWVKSWWPAVIVMKRVCVFIADDDTAVVPWIAIAGFAGLYGDERGAARVRRCMLEERGRGAGVILPPVEE